MYEKKVLISSMKKLIAHGWRLINSGVPLSYVNKLEEVMRNVLFPAADIKATLNFDPEMSRTHVEGCEYVCGSFISFFETFQHRLVERSPRLVKINLA